MKLCLAALAAVFALGTAHADDDALRAAIAGAQRTPANVVRDGARHPYQTLSFFGIKPTDTVVELIPGGGWYTEILAPYLREHGTLIEAGNDPDGGPAAQRGAEHFKQKLDTAPAVYDRVKLGYFDAEAGKFELGKPGSADLVLTFRNTHNWAPLGDEKTRAAFQAVYAVLKRGGTFGVVDHRLPAAMTQDAKASTGYLHEDYVIKLVESVGFKLVARSEINANPKDHADHPEGVWALPPTYANKDVDHAVYEAIGESDRMTLKFVKP